MTATSDQEQTVTTTDEHDGASNPETIAEQPTPAATVTVTVSGGRDGLQGVQVVDPTTGLVHRPGETVEVAAHVARDWLANGWVDGQAEPDATEPMPPAAPARRKRPAAKAD